MYKRLYAASFKVNIVNFLGVLLEISSEWAGGSWLLDAVGHLAHVLVLPDRSVVRACAR